MSRQGIQNGPWLSFGDRHFYVGDFIINESSRGGLLPDPLLYSGSPASRTAPNLRVNPGEAVSRGPNSVGWRVFAGSTKICYRYYLGDDEVAILVVDTNGRIGRPQHKRGFTIDGLVSASLSCVNFQPPEKARIDFNLDELGLKLEDLHRMKQKLEGSLKQAEL